jgi:hypothetical protein
MTASALGRVGMRKVIGWLARRKYQSRLTSGCYGAFEVCVASNVSSIICFWWRRPLTIGHALGGSHDGQRDWARRNAKGDRLACAQKKLEPTHVRLRRRIEVCVASNVSSITCSWSRRPLTIGHALGGSHYGQRGWSRRSANGDRLACAQKMLEPTHVRLLRGHSGLRSIECEFDHLFLVEASLGNRGRAWRIS